MRHRMLPLAILSVSLAVTGLWLNGCQQKAKDEPAPPSETSEMGSTASSAELYARAEAAFMAGRYDEAAALLRDFPAGTAETALAKNLSGLTYAKLGNPGMAEVEFQAALAADPNLKNAHYNLAVLRLSDGRLDQAQSGFQAALKSDPYYAAAHQGLAEVYKKQGRTSDAKAEERIAAELAAKQPATQMITDLELQTLAVGQIEPPAETPKRTASKPKPKPAAPPAPTTVEVQASAPAGTQFGVALAGPVSSANATVGQEVTGRLTGSISDGDNVIARSGAAVKGRVTQAKSSGRVSGRGELAIAFTSVETVNGWRDIDAPLAGGVMIAEGTKKQDAAKVGIGAAAGAVLGEIIADDAAKGAAVGGAAGAATVLATRGKQVELTAGSEVQAKLSAPLTVTITKTKS